MSASPTTKVLLAAPLSEGASLTVSVKLCEPGVPTPLSALNVRVYAPPVPGAGVPASTPVAAAKVTPLGKLPLRLNVGAGVPAAVTVKVPAVPTRKVVALADVILDTSCTPSVIDRL